MRTYSLALRFAAILIVATVAYSVMMKNHGNASVERPGGPYEFVEVAR